jgi:hypothetical protein
LDRIGVPKESDMGQFEFRRLKKWQTGAKGSEMELRLPLPASETGLTLRWCPNEDCRPRRFQLGDSARQIELSSDARVRRRPGTSGTTCPYCGTDSTDDAFIAPEDRQAALDQVKWAVEQDVGEWFGNLAKDFNRKVGRGSGLPKVSMKSSYRSRPAPKPWREDLLRVLDCTVCSRRFGVYAIGFFCPDCGSCVLSTMFEREVALIVAQIDVAEQMAVAHSRELAYRLLGNAHEDVVTAFETYLKNSFQLAARTRLDTEEWHELLKKKLRGNPFQNMERAEKLYSILNVNLFSDLSASERERLALNFEKRHVVGHNLGLADEKFADVSVSNNVGETVELLAHEIEEFAADCLWVIKRVAKEIPEIHPADE